MALTSHRLIELSALLDAFQPFDAQERTHRDAMRRLVERGEPATERGHYVPGHFTASAFVLAPDADELLLILHGKLGLWLQPGGHVDADDPSLEAAARREVREETGLGELALLGPAPFDLDVHGIPERKGQPAHQHFDVRFLFRSASRQATAASDARAARWVALDAIGDAGSDRSVLRAVDKLLARR
jgi:8-oxo-dGTP pyrophosphatase MutT (NUDIX family)